MNRQKDASVRPFLLRFGMREQSLFAKRLAMTLRSGVPLLQALMMLKTGSHSRSSAYILRHVCDDVSEGKTLSGALQRLGNTFSPLSVQIVRIGESSGSLRQNLEYLADELKKKQAIRKKITGALAYPAIILCATLGISIALTLSIFPKILPIFKSFKQQLPISTRILIAVSDFLQRDGIVLLGAVAIAGFAGMYLMRIRRIRAARDQCFLRVPILGGLVRAYNLANISRTMGLLLDTEIDIVSILEIVSESVGSLAYREALQALSQKVSHGGRMSEGMEASPLFPDLYGQMLRAGEETGSLAGSFAYLSLMYEEEIDDLSRNLTTLLEPVLMLVMGAVVGFVAISIIAPVYGITQNLTPH